MPNFILSDDHRASIGRSVKSLCSVRTQTMEQGLPLSHDQVAAGILPAGLKEHFDALKKAGVDSLKQTGDPMIFFHGEGIEREACVHMYNVKPSIFFAYNIQDTTDGSHLILRPERPGDSNDNKLRFNMDVLPPETRDKLVRWVNAAVKEHRQAELASAVVKDFLKTADNGHSVAHVITRWPALKLIFDEMDRNGYNNTRSSNSWKERVRQVPAARDRWDWPRFGVNAEWREKHRRIMAVCDEMLVGAATMARPKQDGMYAVVQGWRRNPGEKI